MSMSRRRWTKFTGSRAEQVAVVQARHREVDLRDVVRRDLRGEDERRPALHGEAPGGEVARVGEEEPEVARSGGRDVADASSRRGRGCPRFSTSLSTPVASGWADGSA